MVIRKANISDVPVISRLAQEIWWPTYSGVISDEQITFMLAKLYSAASLRNQMEAGMTFLLADREQIPVGFGAYALTEPENNVYKIEKLYIHPSEQGKGTGKRLIMEISKIVKGLGAETLELNVNRGNNAFFFYKKMGFEIYKTVDIPFYDFVLNDYIMRKTL